MNIYGRYELINKKQNHAKYWEIKKLQDGNVECTWGRIGTPPRGMIITETVANQRVKEKLNKGYKKVSKPTKEITMKKKRTTSKELEVVNSQGNPIAFSTPVFDDTIVVTVTPKDLDRLGCSIDWPSEDTTSFIMEGVVYNLSTIFLRSILNRLGYKILSEDDYGEDEIEVLTNLPKKEYLKLTKQKIPTSKKKRSK